MTTRRQPGGSGPSELAQFVIAQAMEAGREPEPSASRFDQLNELTKLTQQLAAVTCLLYGAGGETFRQYDDSVQDSVLWLVSDLASEINELAQEIQS